MIATAEGGNGATAAIPGATGVLAGRPDERGRVESRGAGAGRYGGGDGGTLGRSQSDDKTQCKACGKLVYAPSGFDLALIECPHCQQSMG